MNRQSIYLCRAASFRPYGRRYRHGARYLLLCFRVKRYLELHTVVGLSPKFKKAVHAMCLSAIWCIWKARNECVFKQNRWSMEKIMDDVKTLSLLWVKGSSKHAGLNWEIWRGFNLHRVGW
ncbi:hypothetical protein HanRHA438_Chr12g0552141 [Helianthus annuus]|nr:hypothetical protein HanRHA438_Chr12g0552141 [Helianthus annuus]